MQSICVKCLQSIEMKKQLEEWKQINLIVEGHYLLCKERTLDQFTSRFGGRQNEID